MDNTTKKKKRKINPWGINITPLKIDKFYTKFEETQFFFLFLYNLLFYYFLLLRLFLIGFFFFGSKFIFQIQKSLFDHYVAAATKQRYFRKNKEKTRESSQQLNLIKQNRIYSFDQPHPHPESPYILDSIHEHNTHQAQ